MLGFYCFKIIVARFCFIIIVARFCFKIIVARFCCFILKYFDVIWQILIHWLDLISMLVTTSVESLQENCFVILGRFWHILKVVWLKFPSYFEITKYLLKTFLFNFIFFSFQEPKSSRNNAGSSRRGWIVSLSLQGYLQNKIV